MQGIVKINNAEISTKECNGKRVITFNDIDRFHNRKTGTARRNFNSNTVHFTEGLDYFIIKRNSMDEIRTLKNNEEISGFKIPPKGITLITQSGYLMIVKSFTDELSWKIQRQLVDNYFNPQPQQAAIATTQTQLPANNIYDGLRLMLDKLQEHDSDIVALKKEVRELATGKPKEIIVEPDPAYYLEATNCSVSKNIYTITSIAEAFGMSARILNKYLYAQGVTCPHNGGWDINKKMGKESYVILKDGTFSKRDGEKQVTTLTFWTYEGMVFLCEYLKAHGFTQSRSIIKYDRHTNQRKRTKKAKSKKKVNKANKQNRKEILS